MRKTEQVSMKITPELKDKLAKVAARMDRSVSWLVTKFIKDGLNKARNGK